MRLIGSKPFVFMVAPGRIPSWHENLSLTLTLFEPDPLPTNRL